MESLKSFTQQVTALLPPSVPLTLLSATAWPAYAHAGGEFQVRNAIVDRSNRVGEWSLPYSFESGPGWTIWGDSRNQRPSYDALGLAWKLTCIKSDNHNYMSPWQEVTYRTIKFGSGGAGTLFPWSRMTPRLERLAKCDFDGDIQGSGTHEQQAASPLCLVSTLSQAMREFAWCYTAKGKESGFSPVTGIPEYGSSAVMDVQFIISGQPIPPGADGYRIYCRKSPKNPWRRCYGANGDIFPLDNLMPIVLGDSGTTAEAMTVEPVPVPIVLDPINTALKETNGDIVVPEGEVIHATQPIIDAYGTSKFGRIVGTDRGGRWTVVPSANFGVSPVVIIQNQRSHWRGLEINAETGNAKCGLAFADFSGGQAFGNKFTDVRVSLDQTGKTGMCQGVRVLEECAGGGHSASELIFERCGFGATNPIWLEHKQTCNLLFRDCSATAFVAGDKLSTADCVVWISMGNRVVFDGLFHADAPGGVIFNMEQGNLQISSLFVDRGCVSLADFSDYAESRLNIDHATVNFVQYPSVDNSHTPPNLVRAPAINHAKLKINGTKFGVTPLQATVNGGTDLQVTAIVRQTSSTIVSLY